MKEKKMIIAKGRYVYEKTRSRTDYRQRKLCNTEMMIEELKERLELTITRQKERERKQNGSEQAKELTQEAQKKESQRQEEEDEEIQRRGITREEFELERMSRSVAEEIQRIVKADGGK